MRYWNVPAAKISTVENGVETDVFRLDRQRPKYESSCISKIVS